MAILEFMFSGFWTFIGCFLVISLVVNGIVAVANSLIGIMRDD